MDESSSNSSRQRKKELSVLSPRLDENDDISPWHRYTVKRKHSQAFRRRVERVGRHAALATKQVVWDSNDASIDAALSAVDQWESAYDALRGLLVASVNSAQGLYRAAKEGAEKIENGLLIPVRDWLLLPAFVGAERVAGETIGFLQSDRAQQLANQSLELAKKVPVVGENVIVPSMSFSVGLVQRTWEIVQYPIPSKKRVRETVDFTLNATKWGLSTAAKEFYLYVKRADANITRTLMHTQWKVLGSGPYATLDKLNKGEVIDHICERYFSLQDEIARYELAAHIRRHNRPLYHDLVLSGLLKERGGKLIEDDEWLAACPIYRALEEPFLIRGEPNDGDFFLQKVGTAEVSALWYRLPRVNGEQPSRDTPWICFQREEQEKLEQRYLEVLRGGQTSGQPRSDIINSPNTRFPTIANWYEPDIFSDVFVDQKRHAVSYFLCCPSCRQAHEPDIPPLVRKEIGDLCGACTAKGREMPAVATFLSPPPVAMLMRPLFWRFYGPGDEVRRATWFLDTSRHGLQPFDEEAQTVLEDAYLFLKWLSVRQVFEQDTDLDGALLTVEVPCPDGTERLVQFSSLSRATAITKGLGSAVALFKRRVYRGAWLSFSKEDRNSPRAQTIDPLLEDSMQSEVEIQLPGLLDDNPFPNVSLREILTPPRPKDESQIVLYNGMDDFDASLAVPPSRLIEQDMKKYLKDEMDGKVDHLVLIVHGIGEMLRSNDVFGLSLPNLVSIIDCCNFLRKNHAEVQTAHFSQMYPTADTNSLASSGRVEYLPVEWHEAFSILSQRKNPGDDKLHSGMDVTLQDISLRTIPNMRDFANDTLMDVLYFMSPEHHNMILEVVAHEMNLVVEKFRSTTGFRGRISVIGHSLGSIISWDILMNQDKTVRGNMELQQGYPVRWSADSHPNDVPSFFEDTKEIPELTVPPLSVSLQPQERVRYLGFNVDNFFMLGSPVAVFLMMRNQQRPLSGDFYLEGCERVFNIFHPYDPVAYRIEPCIDPRNAEIEPVIIKHWNGGFRVQYQTKRLWRKLIDTTWQTQHSVVEAFEASMAAMGLLDATAEQNVEDDASSTNSSEETRSNSCLDFGQLNQGRRIDYMLQEREIETANEYVAALAAHSSYWTEKDLSLFLARQIYLSTLEHAAKPESEWVAIL